jgi:hypothetical protein
MKTLVAVAVIILGHLLLLSSAHAQYSARRLTDRIAPQLGRTNAPPPASPGRPVAGPNVALPNSAISRGVVTQRVMRVAPAPVDLAKSQASKEAAVRKTIEFQKKRAEEGSESAQYQLGMRYLRGDGVEKDETIARKWLALSATNGFPASARKLEELDKAAQSSTSRAPADK